MNQIFCLLAYLCALLVLVAGQDASFYSFRTEAHQKYAALTFDDGPHKILTPRLIQSVAALKSSHNITARMTFFVMGVKVEMHPEILRSALAHGHEVANHVYNHPVLTQIPWDELKNQLLYTSDAIFNATGSKPSVMRPPYGKTNKGLNNRINKETRMPAILWSLDTLDWKRPSVDDIVNLVVKRVKSGSIILCHDIHPNTVLAIPIVIRKLSEMGYEFKTVSQMIRLFSPKTLPKV